MNYPNGKRPRKGTSSQPATRNGFGNRGMTLEDDINATNQYYLDTDKAVIHKKPVPVQIVNVNYPKRSAAVINEAYFKQASTTDYNGLYRSRYIDFEAKETRNKTSFPLANIHEHQVKHMEAIVRHGGICFLIIRFAVHQETYFFQAEKLFPYWHDKLRGGKKSVSYQTVKNEGSLIPFGYQARVDYLSIIDKLYS
ncbi:Holliday junction resolvase RecU [Lentibacillus sediminis]|uniref:Holliday junction resolvase RecU n=1 Tax=Lentibacillus sediminis TaxID=1940529 RepID=UPI000C1C34D4|nr:Holliday junction resolvase RecU [Lentibacillus sediminis]